MSSLRKPPPPPASRPPPRTSSTLSREGSLATVSTVGGSSSDMRQSMQSEEGGGVTPQPRQQSDRPAANSSNVRIVPSPRVGSRSVSQEPQPSLAAPSPPPAPQEISSTQQDSGIPDTIVADAPSPPPFVKQQLQLQQPTGSMSHPPQRTPTGSPTRTTERVGNDDDLLEKIRQRQAAASASRSRSRDVDSAPNGGGSAVSHRQPSSPRRSIPTMLSPQKSPPHRRPPAAGLTSPPPTETPAGSDDNIVADAPSPPPNARPLARKTSSIPRSRASSSGRSVEQPSASSPPRQEQPQPQRPLQGKSVSFREPSPRQFGFLQEEGSLQRHHSAPYMLGGGGHPSDARTPGQRAHQSATLPEDLSIHEVDEDEPAAPPTAAPPPPSSSSSLLTRSAMIEYSPIREDPLSGGRGQGAVAPIAAQPAAGQLPTRQVPPTPASPSVPVLCSFTTTTVFEEDGDAGAYTAPSATSSAQPGGPAARRQSENVLLPRPVQEDYRDDSVSQHDRIPVDHAREVGASQHYRQQSARSVSGQRGDSTESWQRQAQNEAHQLHSSRHQPYHQPFEDEVDHLSRHPPTRRNFTGHDDPHTHRDDVSLPRSSSSFERPPPPSSSARSEPTMFNQAASNDSRATSEASTVHGQHGHQPQHGHHIKRKPPSLSPNRSMSLHEDSFEVGVTVEDLDDVTTREETGSRGQQVRSAEQSSHRAPSVEQHQQLSTRHAPNKQDWGWPSEDSAVEPSTLTAAQQRRQEMLLSPRSNQPRMGQSTSDPHRSRSTSKDEAADGDIRVPSSKSSASRMQERAVTKRRYESLLNKMYGDDKESNSEEEHVPTTFSRGRNTNVAGAGAAADDDAVTPPPQSRGRGGRKPVSVSPRPSSQKKKNKPFLSKGGGAEEPLPPKPHMLQKWEDEATLEERRQRARQDEQLQRRLQVKKELMEQSRAAARDFASRSNAPPSHTSSTAKKHQQREDGWDRSFAHDTTTSSPSAMLLNRPDVSLLAPETTTSLSKRFDEESVLMRKPEKTEQEVRHRSAALEESRLRARVLAESARIEQELRCEQERAEKASKREFFSQVADAERLAARAFSIRQQQQHSVSSSRLRMESLDDASLPEEEALSRKETMEEIQERGEALRREALHRDAEKPWIHNSILDEDAKQRSSPKRATTPSRATLRQPAWNSPAASKTRGATKSPSSSPPPRPRTTTPRKRVAAPAGGPKKNAFSAMLEKAATTKKMDDSSVVGSEQASHDNTEGGSTAQHQTIVVVGEQVDADKAASAVMRSLKEKEAQNTALMQELEESRKQLEKERQRRQNAQRTTEKVRTNAQHLIALAASTSPQRSKVSPPNNDAAGKGAKDRSTSRMENTFTAPLDAHNASQRTLHLAALDDDAVMSPSFPQSNRGTSSTAPVDDIGLNKSTDLRATTSNRHAHAAAGNHNKPWLTSALNSYYGTSTAEQHHSPAASPPAAAAPVEATPFAGGIKYTQHSSRHGFLTHADMHLPTQENNQAAPRQPSLGTLATYGESAVAAAPPHSASAITAAAAAAASISPPPSAPISPRGAAGNTRRLCVALKPISKRLLSQCVRADRHMNGTVAMGDVLHAINAMLKENGASGTRSVTAADIHTLLESASVPDGVAHRRGGGLTAPTTFDGGSSNDELIPYAELVSAIVELGG